MESKLRQAAERARIDSMVHFAGVVEDVRPWLSAFDLLVQPSRSEGLALAVLEAMAMGVAVLATDVGGMAEAVEDGVTGRLVPAGDTEALAAALSEVLGDRSALLEFGRSATKRVRGFSMECKVSDLETLYEQLVNGDTRGREDLRSNHQSIGRGDLAAPELQRYGSQ